MTTNLRSNLTPAGSSTLNWTDQAELIPPPASPTAIAIARERSTGERQLTVSLANDSDRQEIYRIRHEIYARELGQHGLSEGGQLWDSLDQWNSYIVARIGGFIAGFISVSPPHAPAFSIDKYFARQELPLEFDQDLYEVRLLTVLKSHRRRELATLLMYAAFRWVEAHGGKRIVALGRREILGLYSRVGLTTLGWSTRSGAVAYDLLSATTAALRKQSGQFSGLLQRLEEKTDWQLMFPFQRPASCFHGGSFFKRVGDRFDRLEQKEQVINADVLDAWFPPAPGVLATLREHLPWLLQTSPPTGCEGLIETIAQTRQVRPEEVLAGAGSSDLIFRALRHWLTRDSHVLILDPTYGEYAHVSERVIGCTVDRLSLERGRNYDVDLGRLEVALRDEYNLVVLVNPNSPTGRFIPREALETILGRAPDRTRVWVDETYIEYASRGESLESFAAKSENVIVCKSMSKVYALSGARVAYLCAGAHQLEALRDITPPWVVSLPAQVAAVRALEDPAYYSRRYRQTHQVREDLRRRLLALGWDVVPGMANFLLCHLPEEGPDGATLIHRCQERGLFLRDAGPMGTRMGSRAIRIAIKAPDIAERMLSIIQQAWRAGPSQDQRE